MKKILLIIFILFVFSCAKYESNIEYYNGGDYFGQVTNIISIGYYRVLVEVDNKIKVIVKTFNNPDPIIGGYIYHYYDNTYKDYYLYKERKE